MLQGVGRRDIAERERFTERDTALLSQAPELEGSEVVFVRAVLDDELGRADEEVTALSEQALEELSAIEDLVDELLRVGRSAAPRSTTRSCSCSGWKRSRARRRGR